MANAPSQLIIAPDSDGLIVPALRLVAQKVPANVPVRVMSPGAGGWQMADVSQLHDAARIHILPGLVEMLRKIERTPETSGAVLSIWLLRAIDVDAITGTMWQDIKMLLPFLVTRKGMTIHFSGNADLPGVKPFIAYFQKMREDNTALKNRLTFRPTTGIDAAPDNLVSWLREFMTNAPQVPAPAPEMLVQMQVAPGPEPPAPPPAAPSSPDVTPPPNPDNPAKSVWETHEPEDRYMPVPHELLAHIAAENNWKMVGASIRGRSHAHDGKYREDAFAIDTAGKWNIIAVSDGAGSRKYSRVGSLLATEAAAGAMKNYLLMHQVGSDAASIKDHLGAAVHAGLQHAYIRLETFIRDQQDIDITFQDLGCTLLLAIQGEAAGRHYVAGLQVGDGLIMLAKYPDNVNELVEVTQGDIADFSGGTTFLTSENLETWQQREASVMALDSAPWLLLVMTDGVADDMVPYDRNVPRFLLPAIQRTGILEMANQLDEAAKLLATMINYEKKGSFDDRTLVVLYHQPPAPPPTLPG